jgi:methylenetetrahydrofolate reductase (NADPH)
VSKPTISFEFFPPKTDKSEDAFWLELMKLAALDPTFMTVTYGAGGSTRDKTIEIASAVLARTHIPTAAHLTYINSTRQDLYALAQELWDSGIKHIVALRGDMPDDLSWPLDPDAEYFQYTSHFVVALKARHDFEISVGCYPEKHPDAPSLDKDIEALKKKCDAGANRAITQFFFDNALFYDFVEQAQKADIKMPICPGLLPIHDFTRMCNFAERCQANVPDWVKAKFDGLQDKPDEAQKVAEELLITQAEDLVKNGVEHLHFYTLNKAAITTEACASLGYKAEAA